MKSIYTLLTIASLSLLFSACDTDPEDLGYDSNTYDATFELYMDGNFIQSGTIEDVGMILTSPGQWANIVTVDKDSTIGFIISGIPLNVGDEAHLSIESDDNSDDDEAAVLINGWNLLTAMDRDEYYFSESGTVTRTSSTKISFQGICVEIQNPDDNISFSGYVESEAFKNIK